MKLLHTADWQIGMRAASVGDAGRHVREERLAAGRRVVEAAKARGADFVVVAGDLFEDNAVDRSLVQKVADILRGFTGNVYIIPGNHDPSVPGSVWDHPAWSAAPNLHVLREESPVGAGDCTLYPCPLREKHSSADPTAWISARDDERICIGIGHGSVEGVQQEDRDYPIARDAADRAGLDYLALGHWHSSAVFPSADGVVRMAYSGTHETSKFGERDSGNALLVEISARGVAPEITPIPTGGLTWLAWSDEVRHAGDLRRVRARVEGLADPGRTLLLLTLTGVVHAEEQGEPAHLRDLLDSRFLYGALDLSGLTPSPSDDAWVAALPPGAVRDTATRLLDLAAGKRGPDDAEVAAAALMELYAMAEESRR